MDLECCDYDFFFKDGDKVLYVASAGGSSIMRNNKLKSILS